MWRVNVTKQRRQFSAKFKFQVGLEALKELKTINEIASQYEVHPTQVKQWKKQLQEDGADIFNEQAAKQQPAQAGLEADLYEQIPPSGHPLKMEVDCAQRAPEKKLPEAVNARCALVEPAHPTLSVRDQCDLLNVNRAQGHPLIIMCRRRKVR